LKVSTEITHKWLPTQPASITPIPAPRCSSAPGDTIVLFSSRLDSTLPLISSSPAPPARAAAAAGA
jgi:hypothetical protein